MIEPPCCCPPFPRARSRRWDPASAGAIRLLALKSVAPEVPRSLRLPSAAGFGAPSFTAASNCCWVMPIFGR